MAHVLGLRLDVDPDNLRQGTNWHELLETYQNALATLDPNGDDTPVDAAVRHLNARYEQVPANKTPLEWETERTWLTMAFLAYTWYYAGRHYKTLVTEHHFRVPVINPDTRRPDRVLPMLQGKIDRMCQVGDRVMAVEYKTTSFDIADDADYWERLKMDTQVSVYSYAAERDGWQVQGTLYDVFRKPKSKPRLLSQGEAKKAVKDGEWCGGVVKIEATANADGEITAVWVNGVQSTEVKYGAKKDGSFQFRETCQMFGYRILQEMYANPTKFFNRKEITRTRKDLQRFEVELYNIAMTMQMMMHLDNFYRNEQVCQQPYPCAYRSICYNNQNEKVHCGECPKGFKYIYKGAPDAPAIQREGTADASQETAPAPAPEEVSGPPCEAPAPDRDPCSPDLHPD